MRRSIGCVVFGTLAWLIGLCSVLSFNVWKEVTPLAMFDAFAGKTIFDLIDYFTANIMMPLGAILMCLFVGWRMKPEVFDAELNFARSWLFKTWIWLIRVVAPAAILAILISGLR